MAYSFAASLARSVMRFKEVDRPPETLRAFGGFPLSLGSLLR